MVTTQRALLRLHIEAVWGAQPPPLVQDSEFLQEAFLPPWKLYVAQMAADHIAIWRPDVPAIEHEGLLGRAREALILPPTIPTPPGVSREVVFHQEASPVMHLASAQNVARLLTSDDRALVEIFEPGSVDYYFHPVRRPLIGVIVAGRLVSLAHSSRRTAEACELGIDTLPQARRKGYALAATVLWAATVAQEGCIPFYSALADNTASLGLAAAAGYRAFAQAVTVA